MAKTYTLSPTSINGGRSLRWTSAAWNTYYRYLVDGTEVRRAGRDNSSGYYATNILFDASTLSSLRSKPVTSIKLTLTLTHGSIPTGGAREVIGYKLNSTAYTSETGAAWTRSDADSTASSATAKAGEIVASSQIDITEGVATNVTFDLTGSSVPLYGYSIGPSAENISKNSYIEITGASLLVTTDETDVTLTYNWNYSGGGTFSETKTKTGKELLGFNISSATKTRQGYNFLGWATSSTATSATYHSGDLIAIGANTTLYAVWQIVTYTVSYNANGGSGAPSAQTKIYGVTLTLSSTVPTRTGYTFLGWSTSSTATSATYSAGGSYTANAAATLYAVWSIITYTVSYNANGGSGAPSAQTKTYNVALTLSSTTPTRTGYSFLGWSTSSTATTATYSAGGSYTANAAATLYAVWQIITYTISYNKGANGTGTNSTATKTYGVALTLKGAQFTRTGYSQTGWATSDGGAQAYALSASYTANAAVTLYPVWTATVSTISTTNGTLGTAQTISITRYNSSYTHTLSYKYGSATGTIATKTTSTSVSWTPPTSLASQFPSATSGSCTITCETFSGNTSLGTTTTTCTLTIPDSIKPSISSFTASHYSSNATVSNWGTFTKGYSQADLSVSYTLNGGATLASITFSGPGKNSSGTATSVRTDVLTTVGTNTWKVRVTDSRGRYAETTVSKTVYDYAAPVVSGIAVARATSTGTTDNGGGTYLKVTPTFVFSSVNGENAIASATLKYAVHGSSTVLGSKTCASGTTYGPTGTMWTVELAKSYDVTVTITDRLNNTATYTTTLPSASGLWYGRGNDRLGLGGVPPSAGLHCDWDATFNGDATLNGDATFHGVLDVTPRRCNAALSSAGWYRVLTVTGQGRAARSWVCDLTITRGYNNTNNEAHCVKLMAVYDSFSFVDETSKTNAIGVDKIRYTRNGSTGYVDIHYSLSTSNDVSVAFDVKTEYAQQYRFTASGLAAVADAPSGETILTTYTFSANTYTSENVSKDSSFGATTFTCNARRMGSLGVAFLNVAVPALSAGTETTMCTMTTLKPSMNMSYTVNGQGGAAYLINIKTNGNITIFSSSSTSAQFVRGTFVFFVD